MDPSKVFFSVRDGGLVLRDMSHIAVGGKEISDG
jgi:hypothetical protein